jgi:WD40 repeat protein
LHDDNFSPDNIERLPDASSREDARLMSELQAAYQPLAESHTRSLQRVRTRLAQREALGRPQSHIVQSQKQPILLAAEWNQPQEKMRTIKEKEAMEENNVSRGMRSSMPLSQTKKRNSFLRVVGLSLIAAVAIITILSFTLFSGILRSAYQTAGKQPSSVTGAQSQNTQQPQQSQKAISDGKLACSFSAGPKVTINGTYWNPDLAWSTQGQIGVTSYSDAKAYSVNNCAPAFSQLSIQQTYAARWSPDGQKLLVSDAGDNTNYVLNTQGKIVAQFKNSMLGDRVWSSDSKKIIFASQDTKEQSSIKSIDISDGGKVATLMLLPTNASVYQFSQDGKLVILVHLDIAAKSKKLEIWDVNSGTKLNSPVPAGHDSNFGSAISPDDSQLAIDEGSVIQIYSISNGKLLTSFENNVSRLGVHTIAWSPNGEYIAVSTDVIKIYDVNAKKIAATFGKVDAQRWITTLTWAPDSTGLASSTMLLTDGVPSDTDNTVNVWTLS